MHRSKTLSLEEVVSSWLPRRIHAVNNAAWAMGIQSKTSGAEELRMSIDDTLHFTCYAGNFILPIIEIGLVHARALLEFIGLKAKDGKLHQVKNRLQSDIAIEHYEANGQRLSMVSPAEICEFINMPAPVVEWSLVWIIEETNKSLAHITTGEILTMAMGGQIWCALEELSRVMKVYFYDKLGRGNDVQFDFVCWREVNGDIESNCG